MGVHQPAVIGRVSHDLHRSECRPVEFDGVFCPTAANCKMGRQSVLWLLGLLVFHGDLPLPESRRRNG